MDVLYFTADSADDAGKLDSYTSVATVHDATTWPKQGDKVQITPHDGEGSDDMYVVVAVTWQVNEMERGDARQASLWEQDVNVYLAKVPNFQ